MIAIFIWLCGSLNGVYAGEGASSWYEDSIAKARLIAPLTALGDQETIILGIEIVMPEGWKTYWRNPGDAGFAPVVSWRGSRNLDEAEILWPKHKRFLVGTLQSFGYQDRVILPVRMKRLDVTQPLILNMAMEYLVC